VKSVNIDGMQEAVSNISPGSDCEQTGHPPIRTDLTSGAPGTPRPATSKLQPAKRHSTNHSPADASPRSESCVPDPDIPSARDRSAHSAPDGLLPHSSAPSLEWTETGPMLWCKS